MPAEESDETVIVQRAGIPVISPKVDSSTCACIHARRKALIEITIIVAIHVLHQRFAANLQIIFRQQFPVDVI